VSNWSVVPDHQNSNKSGQSHILLLDHRAVLGLILTGGKTS